MKGLKFLLFLFIIVVLILLFFLPFYYGDLENLLYDVNHHRRSLSDSFNIWKENFVHMDEWNILGLVFMASCIMVIHTVVDHFVLHRLNSYYSGKFILDGLLWTGKRLLSLLFTVLLFLLLTNFWIDFSTNAKMAHKLEDLPKGKYTILLLGTNKFLSDGINENIYFTRRIDAAVELYKNGYVSRILISGDNSREDYNEPSDMRNALVAAGIPASIIQLDFAGFRTLDSVVRSKNYFEIDDLLIVSQGFHLQRALFLSWHFGVDAIGYVADGSMNMLMFVREHLAVPKMILDIYILNTQPAYGSTGNRRALNTSQEDIVLVSFVLIMFGVASYVSYDAFDFGK